MLPENPEDLVLTHPAFERFVVLVAPAAASDDESVRREIRKVFNRTLKQAGLATNTRWRIQQVKGMGTNPLAHLEWDIIPSPEVKHDIAQSEVWAIVHALREDPLFADVEPIFTMTLDDFVNGIPPEAPNQDAALFAAAALQAVVGDNAMTDQNPYWSALLIDLFDAWKVAPHAGVNGFDAGKALGAGIRIAHPDSGYVKHGELYPDLEDPVQDRINVEKGYDFIRGKKEILNSDGHHGLAAASVLASRNNEPNGKPVVFGVAPQAEVIPFRVSQTSLGFVPSPVLFWGGVERLRDAIYRAIDEQCHVIAICLGWFGNRTLHRAVQAATANNIIVVAAAGNYVRSIIRVGWPARYPECIAVAGCNVRRRRWRHSGAGPEVDISGPAEDVWRACFDDNKRESVERSSGTTFATVTVAGVAALWLAHWGRDFLLDKYKGVCTLTDVFRVVVQKSASTFSEAVGTDFGAGIVNALGVLKAILPEPDEMRAVRHQIPSGAIPISAGALVESAVASAPLDRGMQPVLELAGALPESEQRAVTAGFLGVAPESLDAQLAGMGDELAFHILTRPEVRRHFRNAVDAREMAHAQLAPGALQAVGAAPTLAQMVPAGTLSPALRARLR